MAWLGRLTQHWQLKLLALVFAIALWLFVSYQDRAEAVFAVPLDFTDRPPGLEVTSVGVEMVVVRVEGLRRRLSRLREEDLRAEVSLREAKPGRFVAPIRAWNVTAPLGVTVVRVTPTQVRATLAAR